MVALELRLTPVNSSTKVNDMTTDELLLWVVTERDRFAEMTEDANPVVAHVAKEQWKRYATAETVIVEILAQQMEPDDE